MDHKELWMRETDRDHRDDYRRWLWLADEPDAVTAYWGQGVLWAFGVGEEMVAAALMLSSEHGTELMVEIKNIAVAPLWQGHGIGHRVISDLVEYYRVRGYRIMVVKTANSSLRNLAFYQTAGFRMDSIQRDFFTASHGYPTTLIENGIVMRDLVRFTRDLSAEGTL